MGYALETFLTSEKPDIICLQEAISCPKQNDVFFLTVEHIQKRCNLPYLIFAPLFSFNFMNGVASWGNAILSRYPIQKSETVYTRLEHQADFDFNEHDGNIKNFVHGQIDIQRTTYNVITHHGHWVSEHKNGNEETGRQMTVLHNYIAQLDGNIILTGDFNLAPHSPSLTSLNNSLDNLSITRKLETTRTILTHKKEVCDYIFVSKELKVESFQAHDDIVSDHQALILEF